MSLKPPKSLTSSSNHNSAPPTPTTNTSSSTSGTVSTKTTFLLLLFLTLSFFPGLFHYLWTFPFSLVLHISGLSPKSQIATTTADVAVQGSNMAWFQKQFTLPPHSRGSYLVTDHILSSLPELRTYRTGLLHLFIQHTSCALSLNENWDDDVRADMSDALDRIVPESGPRSEALYRHDAEGPDDMPAHIKSALVGASVSVPIKDGKLLTGTWQGVWYLEFRAARHTRKVVATIQGEKM